MNRSAAREETFKLIYSLEVQREKTLSECIDLYLESEEIDDENNNDNEDIEEDDENEEEKEKKKEIKKEEKKI